VKNLLHSALRPEFIPLILSVWESASMSFGYSSYWLSLAFALLVGFCQPSSPFPVSPGSLFQVTAFGISSFPPPLAFTLAWLQRSSAWTLETIFFPDLSHYSYIVPLQPLLPFQTAALFLVSTVISYGLHDILKFSKIF